MSPRNHELSHSGASENAHNTEWSIEFLRGVAAMMVVFAHYYDIAGINTTLGRFSFTGVDLFFVISGFVFAPYFFGKQLDARPFFIRRFFRIYPLYAIAIGFYALIQIWLGGRAEYVVEHLLFLHTMQSPEIAFYYNPAFWSLPPEIEYYLLLPLLALFIRRASTLFMLCGVALLLRAVIAFAAPTDGSITNWLILGVHIPGLLIEFLIGTLAWLVVRQAPATWLKLLMLLGGIGTWLLFAWLFSVLGDPGVVAHPVLRGNMGLFSAIAYGLIVCGFVGLIRSPHRNLLWVATIMGNLSFGIYLFHNAMPRLFSSLAPAMNGLLFAGLCLLATLILSFLAYAVIENPARNFGRLWSRQLQQKKSGLNKQQEAHP